MPEGEQFVPQVSEADVQAALGDDARFFAGLDGKPQDTPDATDTKFSTPDLAETAAAMGIGPDGQDLSPETEAELTDPHDIHMNTASAADIAQLVREAEAFANGTKPE